VRLSLPRAGVATTMRLGSPFYTHRRARKQGVRDGRGWRWRFWPPTPPFQESKDPTPPQNQQGPAAFEVVLKDAAEADMQQLATQWMKEDGKLKGPYCTARAEYARAYDELTREDKETKEAADAFAQAKRSLFDLGVPHLSPSWALFWLLIIGVSELPLNGLVFQIFGDDLRLTLLLALGLGVSIPITAHFFGRSLRHEHKTTTDVWLLLVTPLVMFLVLLGVAVARSRFFEGLEALRVELPMTPGLAVFVFLIINVGLFFAAAVLSYEAAHPDRKSYNTLRLKVRDAQRTLERETKEHREAALRYERAERALERARATREKRFEQLREHARHEKEYCDVLIGAYRIANVEARRDGRKPECFCSDPLEAKLPEIFGRLDTKCEESGHTTAGSGR
jgi:hypothetical protein